MEIQASIALFEGRFIATLSDGRRIEQAGGQQIAESLQRSGVAVRFIHFEWRAGLQMITAGQQVAILAAMRSAAPDVVAMELPFAA